MDAVTARVIAEAVAAGAAAAHRSGVEVREIGDIEGFRTVGRLFEEIWRPDPTNPPVTTEWLRALTKAGNYVAGAFDGDKLIGACVAFFGPPAAAEMHSHIAGVSAAALGRDVGFALKQHQRGWALRRATTAISWTFDPLIRRNAYFNLVKLGAGAAEYLHDFYGGMHDGINAGDASDRLLVRWELASPGAVAAAAGTNASADALAERREGAVVALSVNEDGGPVLESSDGPRLLIGVPADIEGLRVVDPGAARAWRSALREVLGGAIASGGRVTGFDKAGWYVVHKGETT